MGAQANRRPTLDEVALRAGVSRSVASRVINNTRDVSGAAREAVRKAVRELGYVPNPMARGLVTAQAGTVLLAVSHDDPNLFADPFFAHVIVGINAALEKTDLVLMLLLADTDRGRERLERVLRCRRADGLLLLALHGEDPLYQLAQRLELPVVLGGRPLHGQPSWYVDADNRGGARVATEHLISSSRRRIAAITGRQDTHVGVARHQGYREAMAVAGLESSRTEAADFTRGRRRRGDGPAARTPPRPGRRVRPIRQHRRRRAAHTQGGGPGRARRRRRIGFDDLPSPGARTPR